MSQYERGTAAPWYKGREISESQRAAFRVTSKRSRQAKLKALAGNGEGSSHAVNVPALDPADLMPQIEPHGLAAISLFSGGGGLDLGMDRGGFDHVASYDTLAAAGETLLGNRPDWTVHAGSDGDVRSVDWRDHRDGADIVHGGPPCQPFSTAGRQEGDQDERNLLPEFVRCVLRIRPQAFVAENVSALAGPKFAPYLAEAFFKPLSKHFHVTSFIVGAHEFGVPQVRRRVFFVGFRRKRDLARFERPPASHRGFDEDGDLEVVTGARAALGLPDSGFDALAPTLRSTLTGPRHTTSILSSASAQRAWRKLGIWPNGVAPDREAARAFPAANGDFRLSVPDCALLQGFPEFWAFSGATYMALGQIGNSVTPPVAYAVGLAVAAALHGRRWSATVE